MCDRLLIGSTVIGSPLTRAATALASCFIIVATVGAQSQPGIQVGPGAKPGSSRVVVEGRLTPERISDDGALHLLIPAWSRLIDAGAEKERQFQRLTQRMKLSEKDMQLLRAELRRARAILADSQARMEAGRSDGALIRQEVLGMRSVSVETYKKLLKTLSSDGASRLRAHLLYVKSRMTIYEAEAPVPIR